MTTAAKRAAEKSLWTATRVGVVLGILGGELAFNAWPSTSVNDFGNLENHGSAILTDIGLLVAWVGNVLLFVALVGWGVKLGREASPSDPAAS